MKDSYQIRSAEEVLRRVMVEPAVCERLKEDPVKEIQELVDKVIKDIPTSPPLDTDVWIYRIVAGSLGSVMLIVVIGAIYLSGIKAQTPDILTAIGSAAVGALAGLLAPSPMRKSDN